MGVRVKLVIKSKFSGTSVHVSALVNTGYEVEEPEILLPRRLAEYLNIPLTPPEARTLVYETPTGFYRLLFIPKGVDVHLVDVCVEVKDVHITVADHEREVLISDKLAGALGIQLINIAEGIWRHERDPLEVKRKSTPPEYW